MRYAITDGNTKLGSRTIATKASPESCPTGCPMRENECYAWTLRGMLGWGRERLTFKQAKAAIQAKDPSRPLRLHVAGDFLDGRDLRRWTRIAATRSGSTWSYTHRRFHRLVLWRAVSLGLTVNVSADGLADADRLRKRYPNLPMVVTVPSDAPDSGTSPDGQRFVVCPAQTQPDMTCARCGYGKPLCARGEDRRYLIAFRAHGLRARKLSAKLGAYDGS